MSLATGAKALNAIDFLRLCGRLKILKRTGWINNHVSSPESVADHMYRMGMCCMLLNDANGRINCSKCIKMAIVHDLAESLVGDITPHDGGAWVSLKKINIAWKRFSEAVEEALDEICNTLGDSSSAVEIRALWQEYEAGVTEEAKIVKDFDKFEMILQADEYERAQNVSLDDFFQSTKDKFRTPLVQSWVAELTSQRTAFKSKKILTLD
ncbi:hypothetical protein PsorP6_012362 [Peronosclerospora sorghi]|uniref:Uncharacterized protein n=1 Tax=Peronosclerospora sorghi TaxID=230839 RepID=A0ACC0WFT7_9STRA|nr:hypothetical protein PsorP6_012362 [Peronosclerospora sorghi]